MSEPVRSFSGSLGAICLRGVFPDELSEPLLSTPTPTQATCRICHSQAGERLLSPCWCSGSIQHVCRHCLEQWQLRSATGGLRCELCGVAFLYQSERMPWCSRVKFVAGHSWRALSLLALFTLIGCFKLSGFRIWEPLPLVMGIATVIEAIREFSLSYEDCSLGSLGYSLKRLCMNSDVDALDLWELHKIEWARGGIIPFEPTKANAAQLGCKTVLHGIAVYFGTMLVVFYMCGVRLIIPFMLSDAGQEYQAMVSKPLLSIGVVYLVVSISIHLVSAFKAPPIRLQRNSDGSLIVRSLHDSERRSRVERG